MSFNETTVEASTTQTMFKHPYHPHTNMQSKRSIQILEDMLHVCIFEFDGNWDDRMSISC